MDTYRLTCVHAGYWQPQHLSWQVTGDNQEVGVAMSSHDTSSAPVPLHWAGSTQLEPGHVTRRIVVNTTY